MADLKLPFVLTVNGAGDVVGAIKSVHAAIDSSAAATDKQGGKSARAAAAYDKAARKTRRLTAATREGAAAARKRALADRSAAIASNRAAAATRRMTGEVRVAGRDVERLAKSTRRYTGETRHAARASNQMRDSIMSVHSHALRYGAYLASGIGVRGIIRQADAWTGVTNSLRIATDSAAELAHVQEQLFSIAQETRAPLQSTADLYQKLAISAGELGASQDDLLAVVKGVGQALVVNGTSAEQASGALLQFSQALGGDIVRAEEFNSLLEGAKPLLIAVANNFDRAGGSVARLRQMVAKGEVSSREFFEALKEGLPELQRDFDKTESTIGQALVQVDNAMVKLVGSINEATGASAGMAAALEGVADGLAAAAVGELTDEMEALLAAASSLAFVFGVKYHAAIIAALGAGGRFLLNQKGMTAAWRTSSIAVHRNTLAITRNAVAARAATVAVRGLGAVTSFLGGPLGLLSLAAGAAYLFASGSDDAADSVGALADAAIDAADDVQTLIDKMQGLTDAQRGRVIIEQEHVLLRKRDEADNLKGGYDDLVAERQDRQTPYTPFGVGRQARQLADPVTDKEIADARAMWQAAEDDVTRLEGSIKNLNEARRSLDIEGPPLPPGFGKQAAQQPDEETQKLAERLQADEGKRLLETEDGLRKHYEAKRSMLVTAYGEESRVVTLLDQERDAALDRLGERARKEAKLAADAAAREIKQIEQANMTRLERLDAGHADELERLQKHKDSMLEREEDYQALLDETVARHARERAQTVRDIEDEERRRKLELREEAEAERQESMDLGASPEIAAINAKVNATAEAYDAITNIQKKEGEGDEAFAVRKRALATKSAQHQIGLAAQSLQVLGAHNAKAFKAYKAFAIAEAIISTFQAAIGSFQSLSVIPIVGPALGAVAAAAAVTFGLAQVQQIRSQQPPSQGFRLGGVIEGREDFSFARERRVGGFAGEAGPEAILPLNRGPGGVLGVRVVGGLPGAGGARVTNNMVELRPEINLTIVGDGGGDGGAFLNEERALEVYGIVRAAMVEERRAGGLLNQD